MLVVALIIFMLLAGATFYWDALGIKASIAQIPNLNQTSAECFPWMPACDKVSLSDMISLVCFYSVRIGDNCLGPLRGMPGRTCTGYLYRVGHV